MRPAYSLAWLAVKVVLLQLLIDSADTIVLYQNY
jgi:hypothetical protein